MEFVKIEPVEMVRKAWTNLENIYELISETYHTFNLGTSIYQMARCRMDIPEGSSDDGSCCSGGGVTGDNCPGMGVHFDTGGGTSSSLLVIFGLLSISISTMFTS